MPWSIVFINFVEEQEKLEQLKDIEWYTEFTRYLDCVYGTICIAVWALKNNSVLVEKVFLWVCGMCWLIDSWSFSGNRFSLAVDDFPFLGRISTAAFQDGYTLATYWDGHASAI